MILGTAWMPMVPCAMDMELSHYDVENARDDDGKITRESVEAWLSTHAGDFSNITDFYASIEDGSDTVEIAWNSEENQLTYLGCMYPSEDA